jgi:2-dehydropantoate 2-reductase
MQTRIGILGIGGVGGYFGGLLAKAYAQSDQIEIIITDEAETIVFPSIVSNDPEVIGKLDYLMCATKTYDLEEGLLSIKKCISKNTIFLPLYNGVDAPDRISNLFPDNEVLEGCVYIVSMIESPGVIKKIGPYEKLFFGSRTASIYKLKALQSIFQKATIDSKLLEAIEETVWEKFIFISALASATAYLNQNIGEIQKNESSRKFYLSLLNEITMIAAIKGLELPNDIIMQTIAKLQKMPDTATSSMHRDILAGRKFELASLSEFVVNEGLKYEMETPSYQLVVDKLSMLNENV